MQVGISTHMLMMVRRHRCFPQVLYTLHTLRFFHACRLLFIRHHCFSHHIQAPGQRVLAVWLLSNPMQTHWSISWAAWWAVKRWVPGCEQCVCFRTLNCTIYTVWSILQAAWWAGKRWLPGCKQYLCFGTPDAQSLS